MPKQLYSEISTEETLTRFKLSAEKKVPGIDRLELNNQQWQMLAKSCFDVAKTRITKRIILQNLTEVLDISYNKMVDKIAKKTLRDHKIIRKQTAPCYSRHWHKRRTYGNKNRFITSETDSEAALHSPLKKLHVRVVSHLVPVTPDGKNDATHKTPETHTRLRPVYHGVSGKLFQPITPEHKRFKFKEALSSLKALQEKTPGLTIDQAEPVKFTCTLAKIVEKSGQARRFDQKQIAGESCKNVFILCAEDLNMVKIDGNQYHWSHLIAHFLGGDAKKENLTPGTAASNYETLHKIELFIARKLSNHETDSIEITITPRYTNQAIIADQLIYTLNWAERDKENRWIAKQETHIIYPTSCRRSTSLEMKTIDHMRSSSNHNDTNDDEVDDSNKISPV